MKAEGISYSEVYRKMNASRYPKLKEILQDVFEKQQQKETKWKAKALALKKEGFSYSEVYRKMNASRYPKIKEILEEVYSQEKEEKQQQKEAKWKAKALALKKEDFSYREVYNKMNASRYPKIKEILQEVFDM